MRISSTDTVGSNSTRSFNITKLTENSFSASSTAVMVIWLTTSGSITTDASPVDPSAIVNPIFHISISCLIYLSVPLTFTTTESRL